MNRKSILAVALCSILCMLLHQLAPDPGKENIPVSAFFENGLFMPLMAIGILAAFGLLAVVFRFIASRTDVSGIRLGLRFGLSFSLLWLLGFLEGSLYYGSSMRHDILHGLADAVSISIMCLALGVLLDKKGGAKAKWRGPVPAMVICMFHVFGRYLIYTVLGVDSAMLDKPWQIFAWTSALGLSIGGIYSIASESLSAYGPLKRAFVFAAFVFGLDWTLFYSFAPIIQSTSLYDNFMRPAADIAFVFLGAYSCEKIALSGVLAGRAECAKASNEA
jgi:hypothetical protein